MLYKVKDKVYDHFFGWGEVIDIGGRYYPVKVDFDGEIIKYSADGKLAEQNKSPSLSFTEYDLINGGFSQERPKPKLEIGKSYRNLYDDVVVINRNGGVGNYGFMNGVFNDNILCDIAENWEEMPNSEANELLKKECVRRYGKDWEDVKIKECLTTSSNKDNKGAYSVALHTHRIWNKNGCIFNKGVWAEKLEEPEIKEGQMIWVMSDEGTWYCEQYLDFSKHYHSVITTKSDKGVRYSKTYSILNPYPDSIEARAIELLRYLYEISGNGDTSNEISEFLEEIDSYANNPE